MARCILLTGAGDGITCPGGEVLEIDWPSSWPAQYEAMLPGMLLTVKAGTTTYASYGSLNLVIPRDSATVGWHGSDNYGDRGHDAKLTLRATAGQPPKWVLTYSITLYDYYYSLYETFTVIATKAAVAGSGNQPRGAYTLESVINPIEYGYGSSVVNPDRILLLSGDLNDSGLTITTSTPLTTIDSDAAVSISFAITGGKTAYLWSLYSGALPPTCTLDPATGVISGAHSYDGTYTFTLRVITEDAMSATKAFTLTCDNANIPQIVNPSVTRDNPAGLPGSFLLEGKDGTGPYTIVFDPGHTVPAGHGFAIAGNTITWPAQSSFLHDIFFLVTSATGGVRVKSIQFMQE